MSWAGANIPVLLLSDALAASGIAYRGFVSLIAVAAVPAIAAAAGAIALWSRRRSPPGKSARHDGRCRSEAQTRHFELLSAHANDTVLMIDRDGRIILANDRVRDVYGWSSADLVGTNVGDLRARGHGEDLRAHIEHIRREGSLRYETVHRRRDGTSFPVEVSARGFIAQGEWFFQAIVQDTTERKAALRTLSFQAELLQNLHDAVIGLDPEHVIRTWNAAAERIYGLASDEVIGKRMGDVLPSEYKGFSYQEFMEQLDRSARMTYEVRRRLPRGGWVDVEASAVVMRGEDGQTSGYVTVNRDVTLRKRAEAALRASQERLARILETSSEGIWIVDVEGRTEFVNARAARLFGTTPEAAVGRPLLDFTPESGQANAREDLAEMFGGNAVRREFVIRRLEAPDVWVNQSWTALRDGNGRVAGGVGLFVDVSEHRRAREQLLQAQKMEAVGRLASGIAHDFNNLLVSILSCSGFLLDTLAEGDERREDAAEIKQAGERAAHLVRQLLAFGRKSAFAPVAVDLNRAVQRVETILRRAVGERVSVSVSLRSSSRTRIDAGQLEQVILNLAVNARDAMPEGGELKIETRDVTLERAPAHDARLVAGRYAVLTVTDVGCGIAPEVLPKIFEPFFTTKEEGRGTGLGLSTVHGIVEEAGGSVAVSSRVGRGTEFTVYLPACRAEQDAAPAAEPAPRLDDRFHGATVLVVEDEDTVRSVTRRTLEASGLRVLEVASGSEALRRIEEHPEIAVVLTDVVMPQMSGVELAAAAAALRPELPLVLMSGYFELQRRSDVPWRLIQKPFSTDALVATVQEALRGEPRRVKRSA